MVAQCCSLIYYTKYCNLRTADFYTSTPLWWWVAPLSEDIKWSIRSRVFTFLCYSTYCFKIHSNKKREVLQNECTHTTTRSIENIINRHPRVQRINSLKLWDQSLLLGTFFSGHKVTVIQVKDTSFAMGGVGGDQRVQNGNFICIWCYPSINVWNKWPRNTVMHAAVFRLEQINDLLRLECHRHSVTGAGKERGCLFKIRHT